MNEIPKIVFSNSMTTAEWDEMRVVAGELADGIADLKAEDADGYRLAHGGARVVRPHQGLAHQDGRRAGADRLG